MTNYLNDKCYCCGDIITHGIYFENDINNTATSHIVGTSYVGVIEDTGPLVQNQPQYSNYFNISIYTRPDDYNCVIVNKSTYTLTIRLNGVIQSSNQFDVHIDDEIVVVVNNPEFIYNYYFKVKLVGDNNSVVRTSDLKEIITHGNSAGQTILNPDITIPLDDYAAINAPCLILSQDENTYEGEDADIQMQTDTNCVSVAGIDTKENELTKTTLATVDYVNAVIQESSGGVINPVQYFNKTEKTYETVADSSELALARHLKNNDGTISNTIPIVVAVQFAQPVYIKHDLAIDTNILSFEIKYGYHEVVVNCWSSGFAEIVNVSGSIDTFAFDNPTYSFSDNHKQIYCKLERKSGTEFYNTNGLSIPYATLSVNYAALELVDNSKYVLTQDLQTPTLITDSISTDDKININNTTLITVNANDTLCNSFDLSNVSTIKGCNTIEHSSDFLTPTTASSAFKNMNFILDGQNNDFQFLDTKAGNPNLYYSGIANDRYPPSTYACKKSIKLGYDSVALPPNSVYTGTVIKAIGGIEADLNPVGSTIDTYDNIDFDLFVGKYNDANTELSSNVPFIHLKYKNIYPEEGGQYTPSLHTDECVELNSGANGSIQLKTNKFIISNGSTDLNAEVDFDNKTITCDFDIITPGGGGGGGGGGGSDVSSDEVNQLKEEVKELKNIVNELLNKIYLDSLA